MLIKSLRFIDHPILGNLELDFTDLDGNALSAIVIAGANGTGKSTVIGAIYDLCDFNVRQDVSPERRIFTLQISDSEKSLFGPVVFQNGIKNNELKIEFDFMRSGWDQVRITFENLLSAQNSLHGSIILDNSGFRKILRSIYLDVEINFRLQNRIDKISAITLDRTVLTSKKSNDSLAQDIAQLLIDIRQQDAMQVNDWVSTNRGEIPPEEIIDVRFRRFQKAWEVMFPHKKFHKINASGGRFSIEFLEHGKISNLENLSSGEKQIVFRGGFILRDQETLDGALLLLDEPEISLHPEWQLKILDFYRSLLTDKDGLQKSQVFVTSHSPFIVHSLVDGKVVVLQKNADTGEIRVAERAKYPGYTSEEVLKEAFNFSGKLSEENNVNILFVEGPSDKIILENAWHKLYPERERNFAIVDAFCATHIGNLFQRDRTFESHSGRKLIAMLDFDSAFNTWNGFRKWDSKLNIVEQGLLQKHKLFSAYIFLLPVPLHRALYASRELGGESTMSIEFLFDDSKLEGYVNEIPLPQTQATKKIFIDSGKMTFAKNSANFNGDDFKHFIPIFDLMERIILSEFDA